MDFGGDTQVMDFGGDTQAMDFGGEAQVFDEINCFANMEETQLLEFDDVVVIDTDSEESDTNEVLDDSKDLIDDKPLRRGSGQLVIEENIRHTPSRSLRQEWEVPDGLRGCLNAAAHNPLMIGIIAVCGHA
ncbi:hypothetical protein ACFX12_030088 [Malus domestica]